MAHTPHDQSSPSSLTMSSPASQNSDKSNAQTPDAIWYRQKEIAEGNIVRILESTGRRHRDVSSNPHSGANSSSQNDSHRRSGRLRRGNDSGKSSVLIHHVKPSSQSQFLNPASQQSPISAAFNHMTKTSISEKEADAVWEDSGPLSPPPTPRIQRLPTPDLDPIKDQPFCDSCGRFPKRDHDAEASFVEPNQDTPWW